jgi:hypothetical protein
MVLQKLEEVGITLNAEKNLFRQTSLDFFGLNFSKDGVKLTESKIESLLNAAESRDVKELKSLCGFNNYVSEFIKGAETLLSSFHNLLKRNTQINWKQEHTYGLNRIKEALSTEAMGYFDESWQLMLVGLVWVLF